MTTVLTYIIIVLAASLLAAVGVCIRLRSQQARRRMLLLRVGVAGCVTLMLLTMLHTLLVLLFSADNAPIPVSAALTVSLSLQAAVVIPKTDVFAAKRPRLCRFFRQLGVIAVTVLLVESIAFHTNSISSPFSYSPLPIANASSPTGKVEDGRVTLYNGEQVIFGDMSVSGVNTVCVHFEPLKKPASLTVSIKDDNFREKFIDVASRRIRTDTGTVYIPVNTYGNIYELRLTVGNLDGEAFVITETAASNAVPFSFSTARFFLLLIAGVGIAAVSTGRLYRVVYDRTKRSHKAAVVAVCVLCAAVSASMFVPYFFPEAEDVTAAYQNGDTARDYGYPLTYVGSREAYTQQFDAFYKDQLHLDIEVDPSLSALDNPYDHSARAEAGVYCQWDRAFFEGKYYSYFGITPVITFYCPYFFFTGSVPRVAFASGFFATLASLFLCLMLLRVCRTFVKKANLLLLLLGLVASCAASGIWWQHMMASDYVLPKLAGMAFLFAAVWLGFVACDAKAVWQRLVSFFLCGVSAVLAVGARPTMVFALLLLTPLFIRFLADREKSLKQKIAAVTAFGVPLTLGAVAIMWFNAARFGSPFDFGASYQLTVSNVAANTVTLSLLPAAIYHYFLQPPSVEGQFPYLRPSWHTLGNYGRYVYAESCMGVLSFPMLLTAVAGAPAVIRRAFKNAPTKCATYVMALVLSVAAALLTFCTGGVHFGYTTDTLCVLIVVALPLMLEVYGRLQKRLDHHHFPVFAILLVATVLVGAAGAMFYATGSPVVQKFYPQLLPTLENALVFWRY